MREFYTLADAAKLLGLTHAGVKYHCDKMKLGTPVTRRLKLLTPEEFQKLVDRNKTIGRPIDPDSARQRNLKAKRKKGK